jgi:hypothetical protein
MKLLFCVAIASLMMMGTVNAQHVNFGIKAGLNVYTLSDDNESDFSSKTGLNVGFLGHIHLNQRWAIQPELLYSGQGAKYLTNGVESKLKLDYINVPVLFQYMFDNGFRLEAGPQVGFLVGAKAETGDISADVKDQLKGADFGLGLGLGYIHVPTGWGVDARYNLGLSNINDDNNKTMNRGFQVGVFYQFNPQVCRGCRPHLCSGSHQRNVQEKLLRVEALLTVLKLTQRVLVATAQTRTQSRFPAGRPRQKAHLRTRWVRNGVATAGRERT